MKKLSAMSAALCICVIASSNDGHEFNHRREAAPVQGKMLTAKDVESRAWMSPKCARNWFSRSEAILFPYLKGEDGSLVLHTSADSSEVILRGGDGIVYGEFVSRHEFGCDNGVFHSPDRTKAAFYRKDESRVALFPLLDVSVPGGKLKSVRYPMLGKDSEDISVGVYDFSTGKVTYLETAGELGEEHYLTNLCWSADSRRIFMQMLDRAQQNLHLNCYDAGSGKKLATLLAEHSDTWVEPQHPLYPVRGTDDRYVYTTDNRDGFTNLYLLELPRGGETGQIDSGRVKLRRLADFDADMEYVANDGRDVYFTAPDYHPVNNYLWKVSLKTGKVVQLTTEEGWHEIQMAPDCATYVDVYESLDKAPSSILRDTRTGKTVKVIYESDDIASQYACTEIDLGTVTSANGSDLNYYRLVKPLGFDPSKKYPLIVYVYGGPHSQMVRNTYLGGLRSWEMYAAQKGFVVFTMDNRGTLRHGTAYEHAIFHRCGELESEDQMQAIGMLREIPWIDRNRIGVYGWSYGGFMSLTLSTLHPEIFKVAVAGGPVIDWRWYEVMYGERYMGTPESNPEGLDATSLHSKAASVKARTLVIQGAVDDTVLPVNALSFIQKCIDNGVQVEYFTYPQAEHNMRGSDRVHLIDKITGFFLENL